ncbi:MAG: B12-binding domain-containing radical SAM protein [Nitrospirae bacterium]|nr:B12-binding domain-containing radical SAM protein [Nitrospirota bacterium]
MKILFCQAITYPFIGIMSISSVLKEFGYETDLKIFNISKPKPQDIEEIIQYKPDVLAFPAYTGWHASIVKFCKDIKGRINTVTVLGGPHPTYCPEVVHDDGVDYIVMGEAEISFVRLIKAIRNGEKEITTIDGVRCKTGGGGLSELPDLNDIPPMDIDLYRDRYDFIKKLTHWEFSINRGCPFKCTYCNEPSLDKIYKGKAIRTKKPTNAIKEILHVMQKHPFKSCAFTSDNFTLNKEFSGEFLERYKKEVNVPFYCQMRPELLNLELAKQLKNANCHMITMGVESGSPIIRREILNRPVTNERIIEACNILKSVGIKINLNNMVAIPGEKLEDSWETIKLNQVIKPDSSWCSIFQPYPKSRLTDKLLEKGELNIKDLERIPKSYFERSILKIDNIHQFINLHRFFYFVTKYQSLSSLVKLLIRMPDPYNKVFDVFFLVGFIAYVKKAYDKPLFSTIVTVLKNAFESIGK